MSDTIRTVTDENFTEEVKNVAGKPVFVDFWATWCGPCRMLSPLIEQASVDYADKAVFAKYNVDESNAVASENGIRGIPTVLVYKDGKVVGQRVGAMSKSDLTAFIESFC